MYKIWQPATSFMTRLSTSKMDWIIILNYGFISNNRLVSDY
ncbi:hypothetical protein GvMRE_IIg90 [endosymbiont GvMRE of Glomus versiforme]|nr:hypothetical protein GvMRE_IIg90 [endosymbiont GvMRE of Glomus versiforme]